MKIARVFTASQVVAIAVLLSMAVAVTLPAWRDVYSTAVDREDQSHILLALPVAVWLAVIRRHRLRFCVPAASWFGPLACIAGVVLSEVGFRSGVDVLWHGGAVLAAVAAVVSVVGTQVVRKFLPSLLVLAFLLPVPGRIRPQVAVPLQEISARVTEVALDLFGFPIARSGNILMINEQSVAVAEACNGMRMVGALVLVTFAFAFSVPMRNRVRLILLILSPLVALLVNILRLMATTLVYGYSSRRVGDIFHDISGWAVLGLALLILWGTLGLLRWLEVRTVNYAVNA